MYIHREGFPTLSLLALALLLVNFGGYCALCDETLFQIFLASASVLFFLAVASFFRNPKRNLVKDDKLVISPCDGKVVVIEETDESEFFKDRRIQISIFMSPANVHINRNPVGGKVEYVKYHPGKYLVAWHPKSSTENERNTVVIDNGKEKILFRQIAGKVARKIVCYLKGGDTVLQSHEMGFIKFGSRVDVFLPLNADLKIKLQQKVKGGESILAQLK